MRVDRDHMTNIIGFYETTITWIVNRSIQRFYRRDKWKRIMLVCIHLFESRDVKVTRK